MAIPSSCRHARLSRSLPGFWWAFGALVVLFPVGGCGPCGVLSSACDRVCCEMADAVEACVGAALTWDDVRARDRDDFARACVDQWDRTSLDLTAYEVQEATLVCRDVAQELRTLDPGGDESCALVRAWVQE